MTFEELKKLGQEWEEARFFVQESHHFNVTVIRVYGQKLYDRVSRFIHWEYPDKVMSDIPVAVIGGDVHNLTLYKSEENGSNYFVWDKEYLVLGTIKSDISRMLDDTVYVKLDSSNIEIKKIQVDADKLDDIESVTKQIQKQFGYKKISEEPNIVDRYLWENQELVVNAMQIFILLWYIAIILFVIFSFREELVIKFMIGFSYKQVWLHAARDILLISLYTVCAFFAIFFAAAGVFTWLSVMDLLPALVCMAAVMLGGMVVLLIPVAFFVRRLCVT